MLLVQAEKPMQPICMCDATQDENVFLWVIFGSFFYLSKRQKEHFPEMTWCTCKIKPVNLRRHNWIKGSSTVKRSKSRTALFMCCK